MTGGKGIGGGVPVGAYGMTTELGAYLANHMEGDFVGTPGVATGGTVYANALSMAAAKAGLSQVFTAAAHDRVNGLGEQLQSALQALVDRAGLGFTIDRWGGRSQWRLTADAPVTGHDGHRSVDETFCDARKVFFANRGVWDAIATSGPAISFAATTSDVDAYLDVSDQFLAALA